jgi:hypothetical protein
VRYHPAADKIAELIADRLVPPSIGAAKPSSFMCVHFRRGDFVTAGWLGKAKDLDLVASNIARHRRGSTEPVYMATDERNATVLAHFRSLGILTYVTLHARVLPRRIAGSLSPMVGNVLFLFGIPLRV